MKISQILRSARALISNRQSWTRDADARDVHGFPVKPDATTAVRYSLDGAIDRCSDNRRQRYEAEEYVRRAAGIDDEADIDSWQDDATRRHVDVIEVLDRAIDAAARVEDPPTLRLVPGTRTGNVS